MAREDSSNGFIKIYRKVTDWEWYTDIDTKVLFFHCLFRANWKSGNWKGIPYTAGQFISSIRMLSKETGLSERQTRTALNHLLSTGEISVTDINPATGKKIQGQIFTVNNWNDYQFYDVEATHRSTQEKGGTSTHESTHESTHKATHKKTEENAQNIMFSKGVKDRSDTRIDTQNDTQNDKPSTHKATHKATTDEEVKNSEEGEEKKNMPAALLSDSENDDDDEWVLPNDLDLKGE